MLVNSPVPSFRSRSLPSVWLILRNGDGSSGGCCDGQEGEANESRLSERPTGRLHCYRAATIPATLCASGARSASTAVVLALAVL